MNTNKYLPESDSGSVPGPPPPASSKSESTGKFEADPTRGRFAGISKVIIYGPRYLGPTFELLHFKE